MENKENYEYSIQGNLPGCRGGAGHAGCEAALACARLGIETVMFTVSVDSIALMPCNPNIGGTSKGHLVRRSTPWAERWKEYRQDLYSVEDAECLEGTGGAFSPAQADKSEYSRKHEKSAGKYDHLSIVQAEVAEILTEEDGDRKIIRGVRTVSRRGL